MAAPLTPTDIISSCSKDAVHLLEALQVLSTRRRIAVYGAGSIARALLPLLADRVKYLIDRNPAMVGRMVEGHEVLPPDSLAEILSRADALVITALGRGAQIRTELAQRYNLDFGDLAVVTFRSHLLEREHPPRKRQLPVPVRVPGKPNLYDFAMVFCPRWATNAPWTAPAYILETVRSQGFSAQYLDYNMRLYKGLGIPELWDDNRQHRFWNQSDVKCLAEVIDLDEIDAPVVGFSVTDTNLAFSVALAQRLKQHDPTRTIVFGGHRLFYAEDVENHIPPDCCDAIVKGEGELTVVDILRKGLKKTLGTYTKEDGHWVFNGERPLIADLDSVPWPRYDDVDWSVYPTRNLAMMGSRGCLFRCVFCNDNFRAQYKFRSRSPHHIAEEMLYHWRVNDIHDIIFNDPLGNGDYRKLDELCDILIENQFNLPWYSNLAIRANMPPELLRKMRKAGYSVAVIGMESGSRRVLKLMRKAFTIEQGEAFINMVHDAGIHVEINLIVGFPGETEADLHDTCDFLTKMAPKLWRIVSISTLNLDRSELWRRVNDYGVTFEEGDPLRYINWHTTDMSNTYEIRCARADKLIKHAQDLGLLNQFRFDVDIENRSRLVTMADVQRQLARVSL
jgi:radical SAM superfamily enzyme YgiQ (UPF0313 family)